MSTLANTIVLLWLLPVALQIVLPLGILVVGLGNMLVHKFITSHGDIQHNAPLTNGGV